MSDWNMSELDGMDRRLETKTTSSPASAKKTTKRPGRKKPKRRMSMMSQLEAQMEEEDTILIDVNLSLHGYEEYNRLRVTNHNDQIRLQVIELRMYDKKPESIRFPEIIYNSHPDSLSLESIFNSFDSEYKSELSRPFFTITNPKEKDTVRLTARSAIDKQTLRDRLLDLYEIYYSMQNICYMSYFQNVTAIYV